MSSKERVIWDAEFNDSVTTYWLLNGLLVCLVTVVGIPFIPIWYFFGKWFTQKYLASHVCTLTNRSLKVQKGVLVKIEKTVPLDRITDMGIIQGPIMRYMNIECLSVETAGQSGVGSLIRLEGVKDGRNFRDAVLAQRDLVVGSEEDKNQPLVSEQTNMGGSDVVSLLQGIKDSLNRIEESIGKLKDE